MKKLYLLLLLGVCMPAAAEMVSTISYNPSRLGQYSSLKVSKDAAFLGGLYVNGNFSIAGNTTWQNNSSDDFRFQSIEAPQSGTIEMPNTVFQMSGILEKPIYIPFKIWPTPFQIHLRILSAYLKTI